MRSLLAIAVSAGLAGLACGHSADVTWAPPEAMAAPAPIAEVGAPIILEPPLGAYSVTMLDYCQATITSSKARPTTVTVQWWQKDTLATKPWLAWSEEFVVPAHGSVTIHPDCCYRHFYRVSVRGQEQGPWTDYGSDVPICW